MEFPMYNNCKFSHVGNPYLNQPHGDTLNFHQIPHEGNVPFNSFFANAQAIQFIICKCASPQGFRKIAGLPRTIGQAFLCGTSLKMPT